MCASACAGVQGERQLRHLGFRRTVRAGFAVWSRQPDLWVGTDLWSARRIGSQRRLRRRVSEPAQRRQRKAHPTAQGWLPHGGASFTGEARKSLFAGRRHRGRTSGRWKIEDTVRTVRHGSDWALPSRSSSSMVPPIDTCGSASCSSRASRRRVGTDFVL